MDFKKVVTYILSIALGTFLGIDLLLGFVVIVMLLEKIFCS